MYLFLKFISRQVEFTVFLSLLVTHAIFAKLVGYKLKMPVSVFLVVKKKFSEEQNSDSVSKLR